MRLACSPFARAAPPARSRPHTHRHTTPAPEMTIGASTRVEPRGSLPRGVPKPRPPNPFHGRSARAPSLPPSPCCRCRAPQVGSHYRARPNSAGRGHSAARDHRQPPPPVAPRPCPQDRKTARERERDTERRRRTRTFTRCRGPRLHGPPCCRQRQWCARDPPSCPMSLEKPSIAVVCTACVAAPWVPAPGPGRRRRDARARPFGGVVSCCRRGGVGAPASGRATAGLTHARLMTKLNSNIRTAVIRTPERQKS